MATKGRDIIWLGVLGRLLSAVGLAALFGASAQASALRGIEQERQALEARVQAARELLRDQAGNVSDSAGDSDQRTAQWLNWPNWSNWNNWPNWGNWGNWFNR
jgi:hypothetical protein